MLLPGMVTRNEIRTAINRHPYSDFDSDTSQQYFGVNIDGTTALYIFMLWLC